MPFRASPIFTKFAIAHAAFKTEEEEVKKWRGEEVAVSVLCFVLST